MRLVALCEVRDTAVVVGRHQWLLSDHVDIVGYSAVIIALAW
jgi:hypothetical protein